MYFFTICFVVDQTEGRFFFVTTVLYFVNKELAMLFLRDPARTHRIPLQTDSSNHIKALRKQSELMKGNEHCQHCWPLTDGRDTKGEDRTTRRGV